MAGLRTFEPPAWGEGLLCTAAAISVSGLVDSAWGAYAPAAFFGFWFGVFTVVKVAIVRHSISALCGTAGSIAAFIELDAGATKAGENAAETLLWGVLLVVVAVFAGLHGVFFSKAAARGSWEFLYWPVTLFGALETLAFFVMPFNTSLEPTDHPLMAKLVPLAGALLLGALVSFASSFAMFVFPLAILAATLGVQSAIGLPDDRGPQLWGAGTVVMYGVAYGLTLVVFKNFVMRGRAR